MQVNNSIEENLSVAIAEELLLIPTGTPWEESSARLSKAVIKCYSFLMIERINEFKEIPLCERLFADPYKEAEFVFNSVIEIIQKSK